MPINVPGPVPYAPQNLSSAPQMGMSIADMMMQNANQQYQNRAGMFNQLGKSISGIGDSVVQGMRENRLEEAQKIANEANQQKLAQAKMDLADRQAAAKVLADPSMLDENGMPDPAKYTQALAGNPGGLKILDGSLGIFKTANDLKKQAADQKAIDLQRQQTITTGAADTAHHLIDVVNTNHDAGIPVVGQAIDAWDRISQGFKIPLPGLDELKQHYQDVNAAIQQANGDPAAISHLQDVFRQQVTPILKGYEAQAPTDLREKWAESQKKGQTVVAPGSTVLGADGKPVFTAGPAPMTPAEQARLSEEARHNRATEATAAYTATGGMGGVPGMGGAPSAPGAPVAGPAGVPQGASGEDYLKTLSPQMQETVKGYAEGRLPLPAGFALKSPYFQNVLRMVSQYDPTFDAANYPARAKARADFSAGASAKQVTALNTVVGHLSDLAEKMQNLGSTDYPAINTVRNWLKTATGSPDVTNFETVKKGVTDELTRVWRQAGGSEQDIKTWAANLNAAGSREQLSGQLSTIGGMLEARLNALENQRDLGMGPIAGKNFPVITPASRKALDKLENLGAPESATTAAPKNAPTKPPNVPANYVWNPDTRRWVSP